MYERQKKGERIQLILRKLNHGSSKPMASEHVANLMDSDFEFSYELVKNVVRPEHDISNLQKVAPLGDEPLHEFSTIQIVGGPEMVATNMYGLPDKAVSKMSEGAFEIERFSRALNGKVQSFSIVMMSTLADVGGTQKIDAFLRSMRSLVNLTDDQMHTYGVQFATRDAGSCRTLAYAPDKNGLIGLVYTDGFGNFASDAENSSRIAAYGETAQRKIWHSWWGKTEGDIKFYVQSDSDNIGLVSVLEEDLSMISREVNFDLVKDTFVKITPNKICLLYTSPSPRDGLLSRMPSSA